MSLLIILLLCVAAGDAATTCYGVSNGLQEMNSWYGSIRPACNRVLLSKAISSFILIVAALGLQKVEDLNSVNILKVGIVINSIAVVWNLVQISR